MKKGVVEPMATHAPRAGRTNQKTRTRMAIIDACRALIRAGEPVTMPEVAREALTSEATAYRYFPDLVSLINAALVGLWPRPEEALQPIASSTDPVERVTFAADVFLRRVLSYQGSVRAMISATISHSEGAASRPHIRFAWIDYVLAPWESGLTPAQVDDFARLKRDLAVVLSPEALFTLIDQCGLGEEEAVASATRLAGAITSVALLLPGEKLKVRSASSPPDGPAQR
jgi:AcrR family transcriptional regulator